MQAGVRCVHRCIFFVTHSISIADQIKELVAPRKAALFATKHLLGGRGGERQLPRQPAPPVAPLALQFGIQPFALNVAQRACLADIERGVSLSLCCGPPGTGKTTTIAAVAHSLATRTRSAAPLVVICTQQNVAALNVLHALRRIGYGSVKLYHEWHEAEYDPALLPYMHVTGTTDGLPCCLEERSVTLLTFGVLCTPALNTLLDPVKVGAVLVDEASQAWSGLALVLDRAFRCLSRLHLFGDDRQLPPVLSPQDKSALGVVCDAHVRSMYDEASAGGAPLHSLRVQHRMPLCLARFISHHVYQGALQSAAGMCGRADAVAWLALESSHQGYVPGGLSPQNLGEAKLVCRLVAHIESRLPALRGLSTVILTPFSAQRALIERMCEHSSTKGGRWDCKTVDSFQGREADLVILSLVRTDGKVGFLKDVRRANVMLSRSRRRLFLVGDRGAWARCKSLLWQSLAADFPVRWRSGDPSFDALFRNH